MRDEDLISWIPAWAGTAAFTRFELAAHRADGVRWRGLRPGAEAWGEFGTGLRKAHEVLGSMPVRDIVAAVAAAAERWTDRAYHQLPLSEQAAASVAHGRQAVSQVLSGEDDRLVVVVGPCSVHDPAATADYASRLAALSTDLAGELLLVMRLYAEKPRTRLGWRGLINDPFLDGSHAVNEGLRLARRLLVDVVGPGLPVGCEFLDPMTPQFLADAVSWGAIGARTVESQIHRQLASGLSMPVGMKNRTDGNVQVAVDAIAAAAAPHVFTGISEDGVPAVLRTRGNPACHLILRGGAGRPNYDRAAVQKSLARLLAAGLPGRVIVDASHDNSGKDYRRQPDAAAEVAAQVAAGESGIVGVMLESFLINGRQEVRRNSLAQLTYGQSITDSCMGWPMTVVVLRALAEAVEARRTRSPRFRADQRVAIGQ